MKSRSSDTAATTAAKRVTKEMLAEGKPPSEDVVLGQEVTERLRSWCYV